MNYKYCMILTTTETLTDAKKIAAALIEKHLAACVQIEGPVTSVYRWQGKIENAQEYRCFIKTKSDLYQSAETLIKSIHPYSVPQIVAVPIVNGLESYLNWIDAETEE